MTTRVCGVAKSVPSPLMRLIAHVSHPCDFVVVVPFSSDRMDRVPPYENNSIAKRFAPNRDTVVVTTSHQKRRGTHPLQHVTPIVIVLPQIPAPLNGSSLLPQHRVSEHVTAYNDPQSSSRRFSGDLRPQQLLHSIFQATITTNHLLSPFHFTPPLPH